MVAFLVADLRGTQVAFLEADRAYQEGNQEEGGHMPLAELPLQVHLEDQH